MITDSIQLREEGFISAMAVTLLAKIMYLRVIPVVKAASFITQLTHQKRLLLLQTLSYSNSLSL